MNLKVSAATKITAVLSGAALVALSKSYSATTQDPPAKFVDRETGKPSKPLPVQQQAIVQPSVSVKLTTAGQLPIDPTHEINYDLGRCKLVYVFTPHEDLEKENTRSFLVIRDVKPKGRGSASGTESVVSHELSVENGVVLDPQLSPDGSKILLKVGSAFTPQDKFRLYVFNIRTKELTLASSRRISFRSLWWSPDGKRIAFISGGDGGGQVSRFGPGPLQLIACEWQTAKEYIVAENVVGLPFNVAWADSSTILYCASPSVASKAGATSSSSQKSVGIPSVKRTAAPAISTSHPNIYKFDLNSKKRMLLVKDGRRPSVSPDGKAIAFFGSENMDKPYTLNPVWWIKPKGVSLSVVARDGSQRRIMNMESVSFPTLLWTHDNQRLFTIKQVAESPHAKALVKQWDVLSGRQRSVGVVTANDYEAIPRAIMYPQIQPLSVSSDGKGVWLLKQESIGRKGWWLDTAYSVVKMDEGGRSSIFFKSKNLFGLDLLDNPSG